MANLNNSRRIEGGQKCALHRLLNDQNQFGQIDINSDIVKAVGEIELSGDIRICFEPDCHLMGIAKRKDVSRYHKGDDGTGYIYDSKTWLEIDNGQCELAKRINSRE